MNRKEDIFKEIVSKNKDRIYRVCYGYLYDTSDVHDLYQEILINIWTNLDKFRKEAQISTWIFRIAVNTALMFNRKSTRKSKVFVNQELKAEQIADSSHLAEKIETEKALDQLAQCINKLPKEERLIITMVLENLSYKEIAEIMGMTVNYTGVKIKRIKNRLTKLMKEVPYEF